MQAYTYAVEELRSNLLMTWFESARYSIPAVGLMVKPRTLKLNNATFGFVPVLRSAVPVPDTNKVLVELSEMLTLRIRADVPGPVFSTAYRKPPLASSAKSVGFASVDGGVLLLPAVPVPTSVVTVPLG